MSSQWVDMNNFIIIQYTVKNSQTYYISLCLYKKFSKIIFNETFKMFYTKLYYLDENF